MILDTFYPDHWWDSAYEIPYEQLYADGYRGVMFDIDNTLVPHGAPATSEAIAFFKKLHDIGFDTCLISNNKEPRVKSFALDVNSKYLYKADKPSRKGYRKAMELMNTTEKTTIFVGDQLFTDVWGAKRTGITSYLTKPIHPKEEIQIILKRRLEAIVLFFYKKKLKKESKNGN
jgi:HAD superfamily phosphatase (TIGR01668 family)